MRFSLTLLLVIHLVLAIIAAWIVDHIRQDSERSALEEQCRPFEKLRAIDRKLDIAQSARETTEYQRAAEEAADDLRDFVRDYPLHRRHGIVTYVRAIKLPDQDPSAGVGNVQVAGARALASLGPDALPAAIGLMSDDCATVRIMAVETILFMMNYSEWTNEEGRLLPSGEEARLLSVMRRARAAESDPGVIQRLDLLRTAIEKAR